MRPVQKFLLNFREGRRCGYPICCIVEFSLRRALGQIVIAAAVGCVSGATLRKQWSDD